jgi:hypothetical protein
MLLDAPAQGRCLSSYTTPADVTKDRTRWEFLADGLEGAIDGLGGGSARRARRALEVGLRRYILGPPRRAPQRDRVGRFDRPKA